MPRLVLFAACERAIVDQQNSLTIVGFLQELKVQVPESGQKPPPDANAPMKWEVVTQWAVLPTDIGRHFEQRFALFNPAGQQTAVSATGALDLSGAYNRNIATIFGFPIGSPGRYTLKLWLSENDQEPEQPVAEYWIDVGLEVLSK